MSVSLAPFLKQRFFDANGNPLAGGKVHTYQAGTTTNQATYTDSTGGTPNANPVILDANGEAPIWLDVSLSYKFVVKNSSDVEQFTTDGVIGLSTNNSVATASLQDLAVTTAKLALNSVDSTILKSDASIDGNRAVTTNHIKDSSVTRAKLASGAVGKKTVTSSKTTAYTTTTTDDVVLCDASSAGFTITLVTAAGNSGLELVIRKTDSTFNQIIIDGNGSETIDGALTKRLSTQYESIKIISDGSNWLLVERRIPSELVSYTPTFTGFGTVTSIEFTRRRLNDCDEIIGKFTTGSTTSVEARVSLASGLTSDTAKIPSIRQSGMYARGGSSSAAKGGFVLIEPTVGYFTFGSNDTLNSTSKDPLAKVLGTDTASGFVYSVHALIPISGWEG